MYRFNAQLFRGHLWMKLECIAGHDLYTAVVQRAMLVSQKLHRDMNLISHRSLHFW